MPNYRRLRVPGGTYFFTASLAERAPKLLCQYIDTLRACFFLMQQSRPVRIDAIVILPDHIHTVWTLPPGDDDYPSRWKLLKGSFSNRVGRRGPRSASKIAKGENGLWQRRYWEHLIRNADDFTRHVEYCWANPLAHGLVETVADWPYSSFHRAVEAGLVSRNWSQSRELDDRFERASTA